MLGWFSLFSLLRFPRLIFHPSLLYSLPLEVNPGKLCCVDFLVLWLPVGSGNGRHQQGVEAREEREGRDQDISSFSLTLPCGCVWAVTVAVHPQVFILPAPPSPQLQRV